MRIRIWFLAILSCLAAVVSGAAAATPPAEAAPAAVSLDALFDRPACVAAAKDTGFNPVQLSCSAQATCWNGSILSCSDSGAGTCTGVNSNCSVGQQGYVSCGGSTTLCPDCPTACDVQLCTLRCSVNADCDTVCCGHGFCSNSGCSPKNTIKFCICP
jgi:hypothetical protein